MARNRQFHAWSGDTLHAVAGHLRRQGCTEDLSARQEWLWRGVTRELEWRYRRRVFLGRCTGCDLCRSPFPDRD